MKFLTHIALALPAAMATPLSPRTVPAVMSITHFTRNCTTPADTLCTYTLTIETSGGQLATPGSQNCTVVDTDAKARVHSFYGVKCKEVHFPSSILPLPHNFHFSLRLFFILFLGLGKEGMRANKQQNPDWDISWGWDYQGDFTVLTVAQREVLYEAFFGYDHPNAQAVVAFKDQGPNAVKYL